MTMRVTTDHPVHDLIAARWSPYAFSDRPVAKEDLLSLFEAARWAPSSYNEQPWSYLLATKDEPREFERMLSCLVEGNQVWAKAAPVLALACTPREQPPPSAPAPQAERVWEYRVQASAGAQELSVRVELPPGAPEQLRLASTVARYNAQLLPATILVSGDRAEIITEREQLKDIAGRFRVPPRLLAGSFAPAEPAAALAAE